MIFRSRPAWSAALAEAAESRLAAGNSIAPSPETVLSGGHPPLQALGFVFVADRLPPDPMAFIAFARSKQSGQGLPDAA
jgi:hypothetical protein